MLKSCCFFLVCLVGGCPFAANGKPNKEHPSATITDKVNYRTGKGIPIRERADGVLVDKFGKPTPYQRQGNPNAERIPIKEGPDC